MSTLPPSQSLMGPTTPITPPVMVFTPTWDEFQNFERYVEFIESQGAARAGLAKIIPPSEWMPCSNQYEEMDLTVPMPVDQKVTGSKGHFQQIRTWKKPIHISDLEKLANSPEYVTPGCSSYDELESLYWQDMSNSHTIYPSADVDASLCDESLPVWNLRNLRTILDELTIDYPDQELTKPTLDFGLWKTTFPWRVEMMNLYSCNYLHFGAPKTWYAVPPDQVTQMEDLAAGFFPSEGPKCPAFLRHKTVIISPRVFRNHNISVLKITQEPGEIIISFPSTYTAGFSHGFNCAESVNFATQRWIDHGKLFKQCICSEDLPQFSMNIFVKRYQPNLYEKWKIQHEIKQREALEQWRSAHEVNNVDENENEVLHVMKHVDTDNNNNELPDVEDDYEAGAQTSDNTNDHMNNTPTGTPFNHQQKTYRTKEIVSGRPASGRGSGVKGKEPPIYAENVTHTRLDDSSNSRLNPVIMKQAQKAVQAAAAELKANTRDTRSGRLSAGRLDLSKLEVRASKRGKDKRGSLDSIVHIDDGEVSFKKRKSASQPYEIVDGEYVCTPCNKPFRSKDELDHHIRNHKLNCMLCDMSFQFKCHLKAHLRSHEEKAFVCPKCPKSFMYQQNLDIHVRIHTPGPLPFGCTQCDKTFLRKQELVVHQMKHTGERPFKCEVCPAAFRELSKLKIHNLIHTQEKPHVCSVCSKAFQRSEALKQHFTTHTGAKLYKCNTCGREFGHYSGFKIHRRVHTGEKAYKCDVCQTTFRHLATLKTHQMIHTGAAPYPCDVCGKGFRSSSERKQHLRSKLVHLKKNWKCVACGKRFKQEKILRNHVVLHRRELRDVALKHIYYTPESGDEENESGGARDGARQQLVLSTPNGGQSVDSTSSQVIVKQEQTTPTTTPADSTVTPSSSKEVSPAATPSKRGRKGRKTSTPVKRHARKSDEISEPSSRAKLRVDSNNNRVTM